MKIGVIQFPGTNCARETVLAVERAGMQAVPVLWNCDLALIRSLDAYILAGGFSYEDRSRSGVIAALDPIMTVIREESKLGKPVLGICNGAQILVEAAMVPGLNIPGTGDTPDDTPDEDIAGAPEVALTTNRRIVDGRIIGTGFYNAWVTLRAEGGGPPESHYRAEPPAPVFTADFSRGELLRIPAAHAEGRFVMSDATLREIETGGMVAFRYTDDQGRPTPEFPVNPNGSTGNIAAITNRSGTVMAMMPHPERTSAGDGVFRSLRRYLQSRPETGEHGAGERTVRALRLDPAKLPRYKADRNARTILVKLIITDNTAVSVENALGQQGVPVTVRRHLHWELVPDDILTASELDALMKTIHASGELYNVNKEVPVTSPSDYGRDPNRERPFMLLVRERDDIAGLRAHQALVNWFGCAGLRTIRRSVLWTIDPHEAAPAVLATHILMNPTAQEGYYYG